MKKTILTSLVILMGFATQVNAQQDQKLAIGKLEVEGDGLIDFGTELRGMVLSPVSDAENMTTPAAGTIAFDGNTGSFRFYDGTDWSTERPGTSVAAISGSDTYKQIIGAETTSANGVLVLGEDTGETKALILPKLENGNLRFNNPVAGLIYYDTALKSVMVYNGNSWTSF